MILSAAMMCRHSLNLPQAADAIEEAVDQAVTDGLRTADLARHGEHAAGTREVGDRIAEAITAPATSVAPVR
jgi:3-isopropylmalate dehydrogenase